MIINFRIMKPTFLNLICCIIIVILIASCSSMYIPSNINVPLLDSAGEASIEYTMSTNSLHLSTDYAISDKYATILDGSLSYGNFSNYYDIFTDKNSKGGSSEIFNFDKYMGEFEHKYAEVGVGRYNILTKKNQLEVFAGAGYGLANDYGDNHCLNRYYLGFIQLDYGRKIKSHFEFGVDCRFATSFHNFRYSKSYFDNDVEIKNNYNIDFNIYHVEPLFFVRVGSNNLKFTFQVGGNIGILDRSLNDLELDNGIYNRNVHETNFTMSIGINYRFGINKKENKN